MNWATRPILPGRLRSAQLGRWWSDTRRNIRCSDGSSTLMPSPRRATGGDTVDRSRFVVVANRLPVDEVTTPGGRSWRRSPGGLVTALHPVLAGQRGTWVGWAGNASGPDDPPTEPFELDGMRLRPVNLTADD